MAADTEKRCNICGGTDWSAMGNRPGVRCSRCGSVERTRVMVMFLERLGLPKLGARVLHLAPEAGVTRWIVHRAGAQGYDARDLEPDRYRHWAVKRVDLCRDSADLPSNHYDLILHSHVIEHLPCNWTAVMFHLHRALHPDGVHLFCIPFLSGRYDERWGGVSEEERVERFGQDDHVRRFGADDRAETLGMLYRLPATYDLEKQFSLEALDRYNIPRGARRGFTPSTVLVMGKGDWLLR